MRCLGLAAPFDDRKTAVTPLIAPSILSADFARLGDDVRDVLAAAGGVVEDES